LRAERDCDWGRNLSVLDELFLNRGPADRELARAQLDG
jgi:hypothetical protein